MGEHNSYFLIGFAVAILASILFTVIFIKLHKDE